MDKRKMQLVQELVDYLDGANADDLMGMMKKPEAKGVEIEKIEVMKPEKEGDDFNEMVNSVVEPKAESSEEMSDAELSELLKKYLN